MKTPRRDELLKLANESEDKEFVAGSDLDNVVSFFPHELERFATLLLCAHQAQAQKPTSEQNARHAIDGAIEYGKHGINPPPDADHWLMPYWEIGRSLAAHQAQPNVDEMVNKFLGWKLPKDFCPDAGISFKPTKPYEGDEYGNSWWPIGTNLLSADQARQMFLHCLSTGTHQGQDETLPGQFTNADDLFKAMGIDPPSSDQTWNEAIEAAAKILECGLFLHDNAPDARLVKSAAKTIRTLARPSQAQRQVEPWMHCNACKTDFRKQDATKKSHCPNCKCGDQYTFDGNSLSYKRIFKDGSAWCATKFDFVNLQESPAGFGATPGEATRNLSAVIARPSQAQEPVIGSKFGSPELCAKILAAEQPVSGAVDEREAFEAWMQKRGTPLVLEQTQAFDAFRGGILFALSRAQQAPTVGEDIWELVSRYTSPTNGGWFFADGQKLKDFCRALLSQPAAAQVSEQTKEKSK